MGCYRATFPEPWFFADAEQASDILQRAGFVNIETRVESAPAILHDAQQYREFVSSIILRVHLRQIPSEELRAHFVAELADQAARDNPPYSLNYRRVNLSGMVP